MTAPTRDQIVTREFAHIYRRNAASEAKPVRRVQLIIGQLDPLAFFDAAPGERRDQDSAWNERVEP